ncbi:hypothetical protein HYU40_03250 [Candidatus Woesearchaeota archaeon]|nr:hypothetical protein [Candidatus Woesearchaeota archaeon]
MIKQHDFLFIEPAPFIVGKVPYTGGKIAVREGFALDYSRLRVFVGGSAFEGYPSAGINVEVGMKRNYDLGREFAKHGAIVVTGGTPVDSFPYSAARGAHENNGISIAIIPAGSIEPDDERWRPHDLVWMLDIASGNDDVNFTWANNVRVASAHIGAYGGGKRGTNMEMAVDRQLYGERAMGIIPGLGGIAEKQKPIYPYLNEGHPLLSSHDMAKLAADTVRKGMQVKGTVDANMPFFVNSLISAGMPVVNYREKLEQIVSP